MVLLLTLLAWSKRIWYWVRLGWWKVKHRQGPRPSYKSGSEWLQIAVNVDLLARPNLLPVGYDRDMMVARALRKLQKRYPLGGNDPPPAGTAAPPVPAAPSDRGVPRPTLWYGKWWAKFTGIFQRKRAAVGNSFEDASAMEMGDLGHLNHRQGSEAGGGAAGTAEDGERRSGNTVVGLGNQQDTDTHPIESASIQSDTDGEHAVPRLSVSLEDSAPPLPVIPRRDEARQTSARWAAEVNDLIRRRTSNLVGS